MIDSTYTERSVLGQLIIDGDIHSSLAIPLEVFNNDFCKSVYAVFCDDEVCASGVLADKFGDESIAALVNESCGTASLKRSLDHLYDCHVRRKTIAAFSKGIESINEGGEIGAAIETILDAANQADNTERTTDISDALIDFYKKLSDTFSGKSEHTPYIKTGFKLFDDRIGGFAKDDMTVIGGRPSMGKTSLAISIAIKQAQAGKNILWFAMDSSVTSMIARMYANMSGVDLSKLMRFSVANNDFESLAGAQNDMVKFNLAIDKTPNLTVSKLATICRKRHARRKIDVVYVDYMQQLAGEGTEYERVSNASAALKRLANELNCAVVSLCQLNRAVETRTQKVPTMADLRSSGQIEQDAFMVLFPYRPAKDCADETAAGKLKCVVDLVVAKHKDGPVGTLRDPSITWDEKTASYRSADYDYF